MSADPAIHVLFLRGINVGGHNKLPMADLRKMLNGLGLRDVKTYIQSGNAVFRGASIAAEQIAEAIEAQFGFLPQAMVLEAAQLDAVLAANPFAAAGAEYGATVQIGFLAKPSALADTGILASIAAADEEFQVTNAAFYLHAPGGTGRSKLAAKAERLLGVPMTMRNQRVAMAVAALAAAVPQIGDDNA